MDEQVLKFLEHIHSGSMITVRPNGTAHVARVTIGLIDGKLWSSGNADRVRTKHLRANPNATYFAFDTKSRLWAGIEGKVTIHEGRPGVEKCLALRKLSGQAPENDEAFIKEMLEAGRVAFELDATRSYGAFE